MRGETKALIQAFCTIGRRISNLAYQDLRRPDFLRRLLEAILDFAECENGEVFLLESGRVYGSASDDRISSSVLNQTMDGPTGMQETSQTIYTGEPSLAALCSGVLIGRIECTDGRSGAQACVWTSANRPPLLFRDTTLAEEPTFLLKTTPPCQAVGLLPFDLDGNDRGLIVLQSHDVEYFTPDRIDMLKSIIQVLGPPIVLSKTRWALRERVKEQECLYGIARLAAHSDAALDQVLESIVDLIPPAWLYPEIASARIALGNKVYASEHDAMAKDRLKSDFILEDGAYGFVEVSYAEKMPELDEGPFLREERQLIDAIAKEVAMIVDQCRAEEKQKETQKQLRHADRLATIGELSAGVAHELNEPLSSILGFAQLTQKIPNLPRQAQQDLEKIVSASVHAGEIVKKLLVFARQSHLDKDWVDLNVLIADGLYFLESRCDKANIELVRELDPELPEISADPSQIYQVLINLAVNAIQAMPNEGRLTIRTRRTPSGLQLEVQDTGVGLSEELKDKVLLPFFTTKDVGEGTGLGLSVVEGIVTSHEGSIKIESTEGVGTKFIVRLPIMEGEAGPV